MQATCLSVFSKFLSSLEWPQEIHILFLPDSQGTVVL